MDLHRYLDEVCIPQSLTCQLSISVSFEAGQSGFGGGGIDALLSHFAEDAAVPLFTGSKLTLTISIAVFSAGAMNSLPPKSIAPGKSRNY